MLNYSSRLWLAGSTWVVTGWMGPTAFLKKILALQFGTPGF